jgi:hypothetical protein
MASAINQSGPFTGALAVTTSDSADLPSAPCRGLYIGVTGDVAVQMPQTGTAVFKAVPAGTVLPVVVQRVMATSTTATNILALY